ncbi:alpha/beta hydrolase fold protein [Natronomonas pharaonis DSM 2160]|uniref:Alpha/beta hydrolase fold protein n=1 Tax=Natronomonas pharaonis (strain ATCC 35678 / DSM 2160 / CIP 103997 / JCM 8858 / NBRC 14720 / NCIMB 2260 / Gabara) TaxID=348780 RepID=A0A1U7EU56_NATPD|nr:alpha/beta hydrolase [Natronomonas pharaonis]CAI48487.1 alpha/beta hydrolase fold protein [Natronomonas pharaonis DSM 2160]
MPTVTTDDTTLYYERSDHDGPTVAFIPDVGFGPWVWGWQAPSLSGRYETLIYAQRGTDGSDVAGPYTIDRLAADLEAVLADAGVRRVHLVGAGLGAMVALRYGHAYSRARSLSLFGAAADGDRIDAEALEALHPADQTRYRESLSLAFTDRFLVETGATDDIVEWRRAEDATGEALAGHREAALSFEARPLYEFSLPTLVCHGVDDPVVPQAAGEALAKDLPHGRFEPVEGKRCCYIEQSVAVTDALDGFIDAVDADAQ